MRSKLLALVFPLLAAAAHAQISNTPSVSTSDTCSLVGPSTGGATCTAVKQTQTSTPANGNATGIDVQQNIYGWQGWNWGNPGGWSVSHALSLQVNSSVRGIAQAALLQMNCHKTGDCAGEYVYVDFDGGFVDQSGEGAVGGSFGAGQTPGFYMGTTSSHGTGLTRLTLTRKRDDHNWLTDGTFLIDTSTNVIATAQTGAAKPVRSTQLPYSPLDFLAYQIPVTPHSVPISSTYGVALAPNADAPVIPKLDSTPPVEKTITLTVQPIAGVTHAFTDGHACLQGQWFVEQTEITVGEMDVSHHQSVTMKVRNPNLSLVLWQGGLCARSQTYWNYDIDYATTKAQQLFYAFGSLDGSSLVYAFEVGGTTLNTAKTMPVPGMSVASDRSSLHLYAGAEIVQVNAANADGGPDATLEPNQMTVAAGDGIADPHSASMQVAGLKVGIVPAVPCNPSVLCTGLFVSAAGTGFAGAGGSTSLAQFVNFNDCAYYKECGGKEQVPNMFGVGGLYHNLFDIYYAPGLGGSVFNFINPSNTIDPDFCFLCFSHLLSSIRIDSKHDHIEIHGAALDSPTVNGSVSYTGGTAPASKCNGGGAITGVAGCLVITVAGATRYTPYF